jgi:DNA repair exonuclease SbcCD ATPase subunit
VTFYTPDHAEIAVVCGLADRGSVVTFNVIFHEFMHALGLGHARQSTCGDGSLELMWPTTASRMRMYPSTLDLYALHQLLFKGAREAITLPRNLRYEMVLPYRYEIQVLKEENERLKTALDASAAELRKAQQSQATLLDKLKQANATLQELREQYQTIRSILDSYIRVYNSLQEKYENLRGNCSLLFNVCNQTVHELTAKINEKHAAFVNMVQRYNQCASQFNRLYEEHQKLQSDYDNVSWRLSILATAYFAVVAILGGGAIWISLKYGRLRDKYSELLEKLERGEENE